MQDYVDEMLEEALRSLDWELEDDLDMDSNEAVL